MVEIKGLEKFAPKDFPGFIACTIFVAGCNFRCPYCHNKDLVLNSKSLSSFPLEYFLDFLEWRKNWLEGVCISGGEPLFHNDLEGLLQLIKDRGLLVKIDTNGSFPGRLKELIQRKVVDWVAMDIKAPLDRYQEVTRSEVNVEDIKMSIDVIRSSEIEYVFRTTVVPGLLGTKDIQKLGKMLDGSKTFQLQQFLPINTLDPNLVNIRPYSKEKLQAFAEILEPYFSEVKVEGI